MASEAKFTPGPWEYVPSSEHHGPYVAGPHGGDVCDCYTMSTPDAPSTRNGGNSYPVHFFAEQADANARLIAAAPTMFGALEDIASTPCCETPGCCFEDPLCDAMIARAALARARGEKE